MHAGEQHGLDEGLPPARIGLTRGVVVIVAAVLIGGLLLYRGTDDGPQDVAAGDASDTTLSSEGQVADETAGPVTGSTVAVGGASTTAAPLGAGVDEGSDGSAGVAAEDDSGTTISVAPSAGASTTAGATASSAAGSSVSTALSGPAGVTVLVLNAASEKGVAGKGTAILDDAGYTMLAPKNADVLGPSRILYVAGKESLAQAVADELQIKATGLLKPLDPKSPPIKDYGDADVIVVIGTDGVIDVTGG